MLSGEVLSVPSSVHKLRKIGWWVITNLKIGLNMAV
jgi:hypothetical protein